MNRKLNAAITAGLSLSMVLGSTPVTAIAAQVKEPAAKGATDADAIVWHSLSVYDAATGDMVWMISAQEDQPVTDALKNFSYVKPGYKIDYLYTTAGQQFKYDEATNTWSGSNAKVSGDLDLYAHFVEKQETPAVKKHTVTYYDGDKVLTTKEYDEGSYDYLNFTPEKKEGYTFVGWAMNGSDKKINATETPLKGDWGLTALWKKNETKPSTDKRTVLVQYYDVNDKPILRVVDFEGSTTWMNQTPAGHEGKVFVGWKYVGDTDDHIIDFSTTPLLADTSVQAVWKDAVKETHTVNFFDEGYEPIIQVVDFDGSTTWSNQIPAAKDGKVFVGWKFVGANDSEIIPAGTELKGDWNVQAVWKDAEAAVHTVKYYDEGYEAIGSAEVQAGQFNWDHVHPAAKDGYTFVGYKFTGDTDDHIIDFSKTAMPDADVCLQAVWQKNAEPTPEPTENEHTVTIYVNGKVSTVKVKDGEKLSKPADPEAVAGYEFVGWSTSKSEMAQYDFDQPVTGDFTIYAMFSAKKETVENGKAEDSKKQVAADKKDEAKAEKKDAAALPTTGDPTFVVTSAAALTGAVAVAVGMYMTKRREH